VSNSIRNGVPQRTCVTSAPIGSLEVIVRSSSAMSCCASTGRPQPGQATSPGPHATSILENLW
jgi:hypothetical protein